MWILLAAGAVLVLCAIFWPREHEPSYQGRTLSEWLIIYDDSRLMTPGPQTQAADAVHRLGTNALPLLVRWLDYEPGRWHYEAAALAGGIGGRRLMRIAEGKRMVQVECALTAFKILGPEAAPAVPALTNLLANWRGTAMLPHSPNSPKNWDRAGFALSALMLIGEAGLPPLVAVATNKSVPISYRSSAVEFIGKPTMNKATNADWVVPPLLSCLDETNLATSAIYALGELRLQPALAVPVLAQRLQDPDPSLGATVAEALGKFGTAASNAVPDLVKALASKDPLVREAATNALEIIAPAVLKKDGH